MNEYVKLQDILKRIENRTLVLPDFQRKFVWTQDDMYGLFASVLCKMPIGSILTLASDDDAFACKKLGAKSKTCQQKLEPNKTYDFLLDGQQRVTSLFAGFTTYYFSSFGSNKNEIASNQLLEFYFLKIPSKRVQFLDDIFNIKELMFDFQKDNLFSSAIMKNLITSCSIKDVLKTKNSFDLENQEDIDTIVTFCTNGTDGYFRIPLQFILMNTGKARIIGNILTTIGTQFYEKEENDLCKVTEWESNVRAYLEQCLNELVLNEIKVPKTEKSRAIDIYTNLNKGGVSLSVFDLIMAKVGCVKSENFYDTLIEYIEKNISYPNQLINNNIIKITVPKDYQAHQNSIFIKKDEIVAEYIKSFLIVLSLYIKKNKKKNFFDDIENVESEIIRCKDQNEILKLSANDIVNAAPKVCEAMDRAMFFFNTRCGIRFLSEINYKAQFNLISFFFTDDVLFRNIKVHNFFEYWYWISIFGYMYPSNQDVSILSEIPRFYKYFTKSFTSKNFPKTVKEYRNNVLKVSHYSDEETLTMEKAKEIEKAPNAIMTKYICQYYLSLEYQDFFDKKIMINYRYLDSLEIHHLLPLNNAKDKTIKQLSSELRKDKYHILNSPLNMLYITKDSNRKIGAMKYSEYSQQEDIWEVLKNVGCVTETEDAEYFLKQRFKALYSNLNKRLSKLEATFEI